MVSNTHFKLNACRYSEIKKKRKSATYSEEERRTVLNLTTEDVDDEVRGAIERALGL